MILSEPILKKRSDNSKPYENNLYKNPLNFFSHYRKSSVHFGFFNNSFTAIKLLICNEPILTNTNYSPIIDSLNQLYPKQEYIQEFHLYRRHNIKFEVLVVYDQVNWKLENNYVLSILFEYEGITSIDLRQTIRIIHQKEYQQRLVSLFGINRTNKPLIYSTTEFEGYLSDISITGCIRKDITLFPGDVDLITFDDNLEVIGLYEFKKHTKFGDGDIEDQSFLKYIERDKKKYKGLALLAKQLSKDFFYNFIYSTKSGEEQKLIIEKIGNDLNLIKKINYTYNKVENIIDNIHKFLE